MKYQQIDLYQERFRKTTPVLSVRVVLQIGSGILAALLLIYGLGEWSAAIQSSRLESLRERLLQETNRVRELAETHPSARTDPKLEAEVQRLDAERDAKTQLLRALSTESLGNTAGFSRHVAGLARQRVAGLWLREIQIHRGGRELALVGSVLEPELVPQFVQRLGLERAFSGSEFHSLRMQRSEIERDRIDFALSTDGEAQP